MARLELHREPIVDQKPSQNIASYIQEIDHYLKEDCLEHVDLATVLLC